MYKGLETTVYTMKSSWGATIHQTAYCVEDLTDITYADRVAMAHDVAKAIAEECSTEQFKQWKKDIMFDIKNINFVDKYDRVQKPCWNLPKDIIQHAWRKALVGMTN